VVVVGDLNVAASRRDVHSAITWDGLYAAAELQALHDLLAAAPTTAAAAAAAAGAARDETTAPAAAAAAAAAATAAAAPAAAAAAGDGATAAAAGNTGGSSRGGCVDAWRHFHADTVDVYTVWDEKRSSRAFNVVSAREP
jgi:exonuclease III